MRDHGIERAGDCQDGWRRDLAWPGSAIGWLRQESLFLRQQQLPGALPIGRPGQPDDHLDSQPETAFADQRRFGRGQRHCHRGDGLQRDARPESAKGVKTRQAAAAPVRSEKERFGHRIRPTRLRVTDFRGSAVPAFIEMPGANCSQYHVCHSTQKHQEGSENAGKQPRTGHGAGGGRGASIADSVGTFL